eukprot:g18784.t1
MTCGSLESRAVLPVTTGSLSEQSEDFLTAKVLDVCDARETCDTAEILETLEDVPCTPEKRRRMDLDAIARIATPAKVRRLSVQTPTSPRTCESIVESRTKRRPAAGQQKALKVAGPSVIQTLRGRLQGREDTIDLTRSKGVVAAEEGWIPCAGSHACFQPEHALAQRDRLTLKGAQRWADEVLAKTAEDVKIAGAHLVFEPQTRTRGSARVFLPSVIAQKHGGRPDALVFRFGDLDEEAERFNQRRLRPKEELPIGFRKDTLLAKRKAQRRAEGFELFDDWLLRQVDSEDVHVEVVLEAPVKAEELQLHVQGEASLPAPHERLESIDVDSEEDSDEASTPGAGSYLDFLRRRLLGTKPERLHGVDCRILGDPEDGKRLWAVIGSYEQLAPARGSSSELEPLPSWEAFFGGAADLLYYAPHVKADYAPFLKSCENLRCFFQKLFFESVPDAMSLLKLNEDSSWCSKVSDTQRCCHVRDPARPSGLCSSGRRTLPVRAAPLQRYLTARGADTPRTWLAGLAEGLRRRGLVAEVQAAQQWYSAMVERLLRDPKGADPEGDNFAAWLRACHRPVFRDIDTYDCGKLKRCRWAKSKSVAGKRYNLKLGRQGYGSVDVLGNAFTDDKVKDIKIPSVEEAFKEFGRTKRSTAREQVLSKSLGRAFGHFAKGGDPKRSPISSKKMEDGGWIMVDIFQLRSVDLAMILKSMEVALAAPEGKEVVVVCYGGLDHTRNVAKFFQELGFSGRGLRGGVVGKEEQLGKARAGWVKPV